MYNGTRVLDVHSHIRPPRNSRDWLNTLYAANMALESPIAPGKHSDLPGLRDEDLKAAADSHAKYLDDRSVDAQIINPHPLNLHGCMPQHLFPTWIRFSNDMVYQTVQARPDKFVGACHLPQFADAPDTSNCIGELERCVKELGFVGIYLTPDVTGRRDSPGMDQAYWYPIYEKCQELNLTIIIHGTDGLDPRYRQMNVGRYFEFNFLPPQTMATVVLRENNVFKDFPNLKIIVCHCGGFIERLGSASQFRAAERAHTGSLWYDTAAYDPDFLGLAIKQRGSEHFVFGTEAPGSGVERRPGTETTADDIVALFESHPSLTFLSEEEKIDILSRNPAKLFPSLLDPRAQNAKSPVKAF